MEKFNEIKSKNDKLSYLQDALLTLKALQEKNYSSLYSDLIRDCHELAGKALCDAHEYSLQFKIIQNYCDYFFDCQEKGFSYNLGCRYQKIDFDMPDNIDGEIKYLEGLLKIYKPEFKEEIALIHKLISDLISFKPKFEEYYNS